MRSSHIPKSYKYESISLDINSGVDFLSAQIKNIGKFKTELLIKYKNYLESMTNNAEAEIILNDINQFIVERNIAEKSLHKNFNRTSKGAYGEDKVREVIYTFENEWSILRNATFAVEGNRIENDFIIIDESGISTIEVKNIGNHNEKLVIDSLGRVSRINKHGEELESFDMIAQSNRHLAYIKRFIDNKCEFNVPVNSYIVIASNIKIRNNSDFNIIGPNQIYNTIKAQGKVLDRDKVKLVYNKLHDSIVEGTKYSYIDYMSVLERNYNLILRSLKEFLAK